MIKCFLDLVIKYANSLKKRPLVTIIKYANPSTNRNSSYKKIKIENCRKIIGYRTQKKIIWLHY